MNTRDLAILELKLRIERETIHARNAMCRLATANPAEYNNTVTHAHVMRVFDDAIERLLGIENTPYDWEISP